VSTTGGGALTGRSAAHRLDAFASNAVAETVVTSSIRLDVM
jgi:hypothetical protein